MWNECEICFNDRFTRDRLDGFGDDVVVQLTTRDTRHPPVATYVQFISRMSCVSVGRVEP